MSRLVVNPNTPQALEIQLKPGANLLGRGFATDFKLDDPSVSSAHCEIVIGPGTATIKDLGSTNGTFLNQAKIQEGTLQNGQAIRLGGVEMVFYSDDRTAGVVAAQAAAPLPVARLAVSSAHAVAAPASGGPPAPPKAPPMAPAIRIAATALAAPVAATATAAGEIPVTLPSGAPSTRLSIAGRAHAVAPAAAVALAPAVAESADTAFMQPPAAPPMESPSGPRICKFHPKSFARWICHKCNRTFCDLCVMSRQVSTGEVKKTCRSCGVEVTPLQVTFERPVQRSFFATLPGAFVYPFRGFGSAILLLAGIGFAGVDYLGNMFTGPYIWFIQVVAYGFLFLFMQNILHTTAADEKEPLSFPDADGIFSAAFQLAMTILLCFGLPLGLIIARLLEVEVPVSAIIATALLGCIYFPMAFLAVAMKDTVIAMNPLIVFPAILKAPFQYLVTAVLLIFVLGARLMGGTITSLAGSASATTHSMTFLLVAIGGGALWAFVNIYLLTIAMRILGLFYNANKEKLEWF
jgi:FHA domain